MNCVDLGQRFPSPAAARATMITRSKTTSTVAAAPDAHAYTTSSSLDCAARFFRFSDRIAQIGIFPSGYHPAQVAVNSDLALSSERRSAIERGSSRALNTA